MKKKVLSVLLSAFLLISTASLPASAASVKQFTDVKATDWFYDAVDYATSNGLFSGTSDTTFSPEQPMTRGMFVTVLGRKSGVDQSEYPGTEFSDVKAGEYYAPYVNWAAENGIVNGTGKGKFSPNDTITREQIAKILYGYAQKTGNDTTFSVDRFNYFRDKANTSAYAVESMQWAAHHIIINGTDDAYIIPKSRATRSQVAQILLNADRILVNTEITDNPKPTDERINVNDKNGVALFSIPIPATWKDRYSATVSGDGMKITFYSSNNLYTGQGGKLFTLAFCSSPSDYEYIPSVRHLTRVSYEGENYEVIYYTPTDIQFDMEFMNEYLQMEADIQRMVNGIEYFIPKV